MRAPAGRPSQSQSQADRRLEAPYYSVARASKYLVIIRITRRTLTDPFHVLSENAAHGRV